MDRPRGDATPSGRSPRGVTRTFVLLTHSHYPEDPRAVKHATALSGAGFEVIVLCLRRAREPRRERIDGVDVRRLPLQHRRGGALRYVFEYVAIWWLAFWSLAFIALKHRPFAVHVNNPPDLLVFAAVVPRLCGARIVLDMHEPMPELFASIRGLDSDASPVRLLRWFERLGTAFADRVITVSEVCRQTFAGRGTPAGKISVIRNVCDTTLFDPSRDAAASGKNRDSGVFRVIYHGTLVARYGVDLPVRALALLKDRIPGARLEMYGRGEEYASLLELSRSLQIEDRVKLGGSVPLRSLPQRIARADVGVVPNRRDVFMDLVLPTKLFEYVAMEKPVVVAATQAVLDQFGDEDLYYFDPGDVDALASRLESVFTHREEAKERARRLRARCGREGWETERTKLVTLYESIWRGEP